MVDDDNDDHLSKDPSDDLEYGREGSGQNTCQFNRHIRYMYDMCLHRSLQSINSRACVYCIEAFDYHHHHHPHI